ncbi:MULTISPECIES: TIGR04255 family protein [Sorangium]|uniref:TIGR04255 family protein n=1 Tax=Sorangium TaxID=39643 RepID=UPI003D9C3F6E
MTSRPQPFRSPPPREVPLARPPLVRAIAQLRFAPIAALGQLDFIAPFQESIRRRYPILRQERTADLLLDPGGLLAQSGSTVWRFHDKDDIWRVSLAPNFVAVEVAQYTSRTDFFARFHEILNALVKVTDGGPAGYDRFGVRYVNRVLKPELDQLPQLLQPEVLGLVGASFGDELGFSVCESSFTVADAHLSTRWGLLPARATTDPTTIEPLDQASWILDFDMYEGTKPDLDASALVERGQRFAEVIYAFFRWCVTDEFLRTYGGQP